jgi:ATP-dependent 26S proteasome regulatory subunit
MVLSNTMTPFKNEKQSFFIYSFRKSKLQNFIEHVKKHYVDSNIRYYFNNNGEIMAYGKVSNKTFDSIFLNNGLVGKIKSDLDKFLAAKALYTKLGLKYKRNYLFYGKAGGGKSSLATAIANYTKRDILAINLSKDMTDSTLISLIARIPQRSIVLFEDIDCLFEELNRVVEKTEDGKEKTPMMKITLSCILNILDGSFTPNDMICIITTNHIEKLDAALKRDGRINFSAEIELPNKETKAEYVKYLASNNPNFKVEDINLDSDVAIATLEKNLI